MMQAGQQASDGHHQQQSPRGGMPKLSLLGHYASPSGPGATCHGFSILGALEPQPHHQHQHQHQQQPPPPPFHHQMPTPPPNAFQNLLQQGFLLTTGQPGYNLQLAAPQVLQGLVEDLIKLSPPGSPPMDGRAAGGGIAQPSSYALLSLLEQKTDQLQAMVHSLLQSSQHNGGSVQPHTAMAAARIASNISQLAAAISVAQPQSCLLPDVQLGAPLFNTLAAPTPAAAVRNPLPLVEQHRPAPPPPPQAQPPPPPQQQHDSVAHAHAHAFNLEVIHQPGLSGKNVVAEGECGTRAAPPPPTAPSAAAAAPPATVEDGGDSGTGSRDDDDDADAEDLMPGTYDLVEMNAVEILAEHTHFCDKCGKGFKRDANLRMHMRGHGEQYKSPAALARPDKSATDPSLLRPRRYSCPYAGCKRNKKHRKFQPLKTVLCVKNHYRRSHCPKSLTCSKCKSKKFSVVADLKTHEKHCGRDKWQCSCGTTFSRKDKLLGHISLFQGHTPALPLHDVAEASSASASTPAAEQGSVAADEQQQQQQQRAD